MAIKKYKPTSPGRRGMAIARHDEDETKRMLGDTIVSFLRPER